MLGGGGGSKKLFGFALGTQICELSILDKHNNKFQQKSSKISRQKKRCAKQTAKLPQSFYKNVRKTTEKNLENIPQTFPHKLLKKRYAKYTEEIYQNLL